MDDVDLNDLIKTKRMLIYLQRYQEAILGLSRIMSIYSIKMLEDNVELLIDTECADSNFDIANALCVMLHVVNKDMQETIETYKDSVEDSINKKIGEDDV